MSSFQNKFERRAPNAQNAVDIFSGAWACALSGVIPGIVAGPLDVFTSDNRPRLAAQLLGPDGTTFSNMSVLELGPLEAAHSYQIEQLGAREILAIEANIEAFLKCLIVKELINLQRTRFVLGDFVEYLKSSDKRFDLVFCSGVLYHLPHPLELIELISKTTDRVFVWTHYFEKARCPGRKSRLVTHAGFEATYHELRYPNMDDSQFWGGNKPVAAWLDRQAIIEAFAHFGFSDVRVMADAPDHDNGPSLTLAIKR